MNIHTFVPGMIHVVKSLRFDQTLTEISYNTWYKYYQERESIQLAYGSCYIVYKFILKNFVQVLIVQ